MTNTTSLELGHRSSNAGKTASSVARGHVGAAVMLTAVTVAIGLGFALAFGPVAVFLFLLPLPVPLTLLWLSADVVRGEGGAR